MFVARNALLVPAATNKAVFVSATSNAGNTVTLPAHEVGNLILVSAHRDDLATIPSVPSASGTVPAWTTLLSGAGNTNALVTVWYVATNTNHTSGTFTNADTMMAYVVRGQDPWPFGGTAEAGATSAADVICPAVTLSRQDGTSALLHIGAHRLATAVSAVPSGYTRRDTSSNSHMFLNTKDITTTDGAMTQGVTTSSGGYRGHSLEIVSRQGSISFDAVGTGYSGVSASSSWSHTAAAGAYVFAAIQVRTATPGITSITHDGNAMTLLGSVNAGGDTGRPLYLYGITDVSGGTKTIAVTLAGTPLSVTGNSASFTGASYIGTPVSTSATGSSISHSVSCAPGQRIYQVTGAAAGGAITITTPSAGQVVYNGSTTTTTRVALSHAGAPAIFGASTSATGDLGSIGVTLKPSLVVPTFDAADDGARNNSTNISTGLSWTQAVSQNNSDVYVATACNYSFGMTAACDGVTMTLVASMGFNDAGANGRLDVWRATGVAAGSRSMTAGPSGANFMSVSAVSAVYQNVQNTSPVTTSHGFDNTASSPPTLSQAVTPNAGQRVLHVFGMKPTGTGITSYMNGQTGGTLRTAHANDMTGNGPPSISLSDTDTSATFEAVANSSGVAIYWAGIAIPMEG